MEINATTDHHYLSPDFHPLTLSAVCRPETSASALQNPRKKRSKFIRTGKSPSAPKMTRPCSECGKRFWSLKALFGHMRCHPEREWRGINPPPNFRRSEQHMQVTSCSSDPDNYTEEDHEVAACLLMLANGPATAESVTYSINEYSEADLNMIDGRLECKKVLGSQQAVGGQKNVKGWYAIRKNEEEEGWLSGEITNSSSSNGHKCSICFRVFSCGQALGGHMRCHWEKVEEASSIFHGLLDLNFNQNDDDEAAGAASSSSSGGRLSLDLRFLSQY